MRVRDRREAILSAGRQYIGVTNDLHRRVSEHRHRLVPGFTSKYFLELLVYLEDTDDVGAAGRKSP